ncbi:hypothetical protein Tco_1429524 [Tanacetum coccineum]
MLTGKWTRTNADCQKFNAIYKHLERKSGENEADHIEAAKISFAAQQQKGRKFQLEHCWRILRGHPKWDAPTPLDTEDHTEIFGADGHYKAELRIRGEESKRNGDDRVQRNGVSHD